MIDLDGGSLLRCYGDEEHIIPKRLQKALSMALKDDCGKFYRNVVLDGSLSVFTRAS